MYEVWVFRAGERHIVGQYGTRRQAALIVADYRARGEMADFDTARPLSEATGLEPLCLHAGRFPCAQCRANRRWNDAATRVHLSEDEFRAVYTGLAETLGSRPAR